MKLTSSIFAFGLSAALVAAAPSSPPLAKRYANAITTDAPFSQSDAQLNSVDLICPYGIATQDKKNILFIQGTGETGEDSFAQGYVPAFHAQGFSTCYANLPNRSLSDAQVTSEYVVSLIDRLYSQSGNKQLVIAGHSQGNLNIQWALNFWPSRRNKVSNFLSFSGDFHGTDEGQFVVLAQQALVAGGAAAVIQQSRIAGQNTKFLAALNKHGDMPLVPTTSMYGDQDEIIQLVRPNTDLNDVSVPNSYSHISLSTACLGRTAGVVDHFRSLLSAPAFWISLDAIANGVGNVQRARTLATKQGKDFCSDLVPGATNQAVPALVKNIVASAISVGSNNFLTQSVRTEPALMPYAQNQP